MAKKKRLAWIDVTSFSRGETDRTPRTWELDAGDFRLVVTRHIHYPPDTWVFGCDPFVAVDLQTNDLREAQNKACRIFLERLQEAVDAIPMPKESQ